MIPDSGDLPKVIASAIVSDVTGELFTLQPPARHHDVIRHMAQLGLPTPIMGKQGFLLSDGTFAHRRMAWECAAYNDQFLPGKGLFKELFSEDVW